MTILELTQRLDDIQVIIDDVRRELDRLPRQDSLISNQIERITDAVEVQYRLPKGSVHELSRKREIVEARQMSMLLITYVMKLSPTKVSLIFNNYSARTVSYSIETMRDFFEFNTDIYDKFIRVCNKLRIDKKLINEMITKN